MVDGVAEDIFSAQDDGDVADVAQEAFHGNPMSGQGILRALQRAGLLVLADKGYQGAEGPVITPDKGRNKPDSRKQANRSHARLRGPGGRANAQLKSWKILRKLRCSPNKTGHLAKAIHVLQTRETHKSVTGASEFVSSSEGTSTRALTPSRSSSSTSTAIIRSCMGGGMSLLQST